jgi:hypothetical protein
VSAITVSILHNDNAPERLLLSRKIHVKTRESFSNMLLSKHKVETIKTGGRGRESEKE